MELLKILNAEGRELLVRDLAEERGPLLVIAEGESVRLGVSAASDDRVIGAVIRTEDGWNLASSDSSSPVVAGAKSGGDLPLVGGSALVLGGFVFRLESDVAVSGRVLLWRVDKGTVSSENIVSGRNVVAVDGLSDRLTVNPAVARDIVCEFYPAADGVEVIAADGSRLSVPAAQIFACGRFEGIVLEGSEAVAAMKSRRPFSHPGRHVRERLLFALVGAATVIFGAAFLNRMTRAAEARLAEPRGAVRVASTWKGGGVSTYSDDAYLYMLSAYREMPVILGPRPSPTAADLIRRAELLKDDPDVVRMAAFLRQVTELQEVVLSCRWNELDALLAKVDREMFVRADGLVFLDDIRELSVCANTTAPRLITEITDIACTNHVALQAKAEKALADLHDNIFGNAPEVRRYLDQAANMREDVVAYVTARERLLEKGEGINELRTVFSLLRAELDEPAYEPLFARETKLWQTYLTERIATILAESEKGGSAAVGSLTGLCELAEDMGVPAERLQTWNEEVKRISRKLETRCQSLYQQYRLTAGSDPAAAERILDELISISAGNEKFNGWANREKARRAESEGAKK